MGLEQASAVALAETSGMVSSTATQVQTNTQAAGALSSQSLTGKHPSFKLNPASRNNPSLYVEDDEAIGRGVTSWTADVLNSVRRSASDVFNNTARQLLATAVDPAFMTPGPGLTPGLGTPHRVAQVFNNLARSVVALTNTKGEGNQVEKATEALVKAGKLVYLQGGSALYLEAPFVVQSGQMVVQRGKNVMVEAGDHMVRAESELHRVNHFVIASGRITQIVTDDVVVAQGAGVTKPTGGSYKVVQTLPGSDIQFQAGKDFKIKTLTGGFSANSTGVIALTSLAGITVGSPVSVAVTGTQVDIQAILDGSFTAGGQLTLGAMGTASLMAGGGLFLGSTGLVTINGPLVQLGMGAMSPPASVPELPVADLVPDTVLPPTGTLLPLVPTFPDKGPAPSVETKAGRNPSNVNLPRQTKMGDRNR